MKPLSPLLYIKNNIKNVLPIFISMTIGVSMIYIFSLFSETTIKMITSVSFDIVDKYNIAYTSNDNPLPVPYLKMLENDHPNNTIPVRMNLSGLPYYRGGMGGTTMLTFNIFEEDTQTLLNNYNLRLTKGKLPQNNQYEILVPQEYALQNHLTIGDHIGTDISDEYALQGSYRICGLTQGKVIFAITCQPGSQTKETAENQGILYKIGNSSPTQQNQLTPPTPNDVITLNTDYYTQEYASTLKSMQTLTYTLTAIMILVLSIALGNLNIVLHSNRRQELRILKAIGYPKETLTKKLWTENLLICIGGCLTGITLTTLCVFLLNKFTLIPQGKTIELLSPQGLTASFIMPITVSILSLLPTLMHNTRNNKL